MWVKKTLPLNVKLSFLDPISKLLRTDLAARNQESGADRHRLEIKPSRPNLLYSFKLLIQEWVCSASIVFSVRAF